MIETDVLVVGGGVAGMAAALDLARGGWQVMIVEKEAFLGGKWLDYGCKAGTDCSRCNVCLGFPLVEEVTRQENISLATATEAGDVTGQAGSFTISLAGSGPRIDWQQCDSCGRCREACPAAAILPPHPRGLPWTYRLDNSSCRRVRGEDCRACASACPRGALELEPGPREPLQARAIVVATGFSPFAAAGLPEYGYGFYPQVVTALEMEAAISRGDLDYLQGGRQALIQCAGSRSRKLGHDYCSRVCCGYSLRLARFLMARQLAREVTVFYMDLQLHDNRLQDLYQELQATPGLKLVRGMPAEVRRGGENRLSIRYEDLGRSILTTEEFDRVVLAVGLAPGKDEPLPGLSLARGPSGFLAARDDGEGVQTGIPGVFLAGACQAPRDLQESIAHGRLAAVRVRDALTGSGAITVARRLLPAGDAEGAGRSGAIATRRLRLATAFAGRSPGPVLPTVESPPAGEETALNITDAELPAPAAAFQEGTGMTGSSTSKAEGDTAREVLVVGRGASALLATRQLLDGGCRVLLLDDDGAFDPADPTGELAVKLQQELQDHPGLTCLPGLTVLAVDGDAGAFQVTVGDGRRLVTLQAGVILLASRLAANLPAAALPAAPAGSRHLLPMKQEMQLAPGDAGPAGAAGSRPQWQQPPDHSNGRVPDAGTTGSGAGNQRGNEAAGPVAGDRVLVLTQQQLAALLAAGEGKPPSDQEKVAAGLAAGGDNHNPDQGRLAAGLAAGEGTAAATWWQTPSVPAGTPPAGLTGDAVRERLKRGGEVVFWLDIAGDAAAAIHALAWQNLAALLKQWQPDTPVYFLARQMRVAAAPELEALYGRLREAGVIFIKPEAPPAWDGDALIVRDPTCQAPAVPAELSGTMDRHQQTPGNGRQENPRPGSGQPVSVAATAAPLAGGIRLNPALLVVSEELGITPASLRLWQHLGLKAGPGRPDAESGLDSLYHRTATTNRQGIFVLAAGREPLPDGEARRTAVLAAAAVREFLSPGEPEEMSVTLALRPPDGACAACLTCVRTCPHGAMVIQGKALVRKRSCQGCGICVAECPAHALALPGYSDAELLAPVGNGEVGR